MYSSPTEMSGQNLHLLSDTGICMGGVKDELLNLTDGIDGLAKGLEDDLESILGHPCYTTIESVDPETGQVDVRVELDLAELRDKLIENGRYNNIHLSIDEDLTFHVTPQEKTEPTVSDGREVSGQPPVADE